MTNPTTGPGYPTQSELEHYEQLRRERKAKAGRGVEQNSQPNSKTSQPIQESWARAFAAVRSEHRAIG